MYNLTPRKIKIFVQSSIINILLLQCKSFFKNNECLTEVALRNQKKETYHQVFDVNFNIIWGKKKGFEVD